MSVVKVAKTERSEETARTAERQEYCVLIAKTSLELVNLEVAGDVRALPGAVKRLQIF